MLSYFSPSLDSGHGPVRFYNRDQPYYDFTNFAEYELVIDNICYWTSDHYFQSQKLIGTPFLRNLCELPHPRQAFQLWVRIPAGPRFLWVRIPADFCGFESQIFVGSNPSCGLWVRIPAGPRFFLGSSLSQQHFKTILSHSSVVYIFEIIQPIVGMTTKELNG